MGLKYIFELFDQTKKGHLTFLQFEQLFIYLGLNKYSRPHLYKMFMIASEGKNELEFQDFVNIMKNT